jgi:hypothetical protein
MKSRNPSLRNPARNALWTVQNAGPPISAALAKLRFLPMKRLLDCQAATKPWQPAIKPETLWMLLVECSR